MAPQSRAKTASHSSPYSSPQHPSPSTTLADIQILHLRPHENTPDSTQTHAPMSSSASVDGDVDEGEEDEEEEEEEEEEEDDDADFQSHYSLDAARSSSASPSSSSSSSSSPSSGPDHDNNESSGGGGGVVDPQPITPFLTHHNSFSLPSFAPPFYNRPPTPLPPSPSLTSLLRPSFSTNTTSSRPTTPDSSDNDTPNDDTEAAVAKSARIATRVARASPKVPTYEYYGFVLYLLSSLAFRTSYLLPPPLLTFPIFPPILFLSPILGILLERMFFVQS